MLELILTLLLGKENSEKISPLLTTLKDNGYDLKATLRNLDISTLMPLVTSLLERLPFVAQNRAESVSSPTFNEDFDDLKQIAGQEITDLLGGYFELN